jgi:hypothetical protein
MVHSTKLQSDRYIEDCYIGNKFWIPKISTFGPPCNLSDQGQHGAHPCPTLGINYDWVKLPNIDMWISIHKQPKNEWNPYAHYFTIANARYLYSV